MENKEIVSILESAQSNSLVLVNAINKLTSELAISKEKNITWDKLKESKDGQSMQNVAKSLKIKNFGGTKLYRELKELEIMNKDNSPRQSYINQGYFIQIQHEWSDKQGNLHLTPTTKVTPKGIEFIKRKIVDKMGL